ncbi:DNA binding protein [Bacillus phage fHSPT3]
MEYGVYLESSIVDLKPRVLDFLTKIVEKAKEIKDFSIAFKKKELAELAGKDTRTVSRYLSELEEKDIIQTKGVRGRAGGTVIVFNTKMIRFDTSDKAFINSDEPISIDDIVEKKMPKKEKEPKKKTRNRRTKQQMIEAKILRSKEQEELDKLNKELKELGGVPTWDWFKKTDDPVGNYRTYLLSRLYNRYAALFTDRHNAEVDVYGEGNKVPVVSNSYDVLPEEFFGSSRWKQFEKFRQFCEENDIQADIYLSAQFSRSVYTGALNNSKKVLPFVNALIGDTAYDVYKQYCDYQKRNSVTYVTYQQIPAQFADDFVVRAIIEAYETAEVGTGLLHFRHSIDDFLTGVGVTDKEEALIDFYRLTEENLLNEKVSLKTRDTIKKFVLLQSMILSGGATRLPSYFILGLEHTQVVLASIRKMAQTKEQARDLQAKALGMLLHPTADQKEQMNSGKTYAYQYSVLDETPKVLELIMGRKNLHLSLSDLNEAFREYGKEKIPVDDYSVLDIDQIVKFMDNGEYIDEDNIVNYDNIAVKREWELTTDLSEGDFLAEAVDEFFKEDDTLVN